MTYSRPLTWRLWVGGRAAGCGLIPLFLSAKAASAAEPPDPEITTSSATGPHVGASPSDMESALIPQPTVVVQSSDASARPASGEPPSPAAGFGVAPFAGVTYSGETSVMFGAAAVLFYRPPPDLDRRSSQMVIGLAYSVRNQFASSITSDIFLLGDQLLARSQFNFLRYPDSFFGVGNDTSLEDEERFTPLTFEIRASAQYQILEDFFVGPAIRYQTVSIKSVEPGGLLAAGDVLGADGGQEVWLGLAADYDTRDNTLYPTHGEYFQYFTIIADPKFGSDYRTGLTRLDLRRYLHMPVEDHVLALQLLGRFATGEVPFYDLGRLGGERLLRGHFNGRYRDRQLLAAQAEYRLPLVWRFGLVGFAGIGEVADTFKDFRVLETRYSVGGGVRFNVSKKERINFRADFGWGGDEYDFYVNVGEVF